MADPIRQHYPPPTFEPDTKRYFARHYWYQRNARWTPEQDSRYRAPTNALNAVAFHDCPDPTMPELASAQIDT